MKQSEDRTRELEKYFLSMDQKVQLQPGKKKEVLQQVNSGIDNLEGSMDKRSTYKKKVSTPLKYYLVLGSVASLILVLFLPSVSQFIGESSPDRSHLEKLYEIVEKHTTFTNRIPVFDDFQVNQINHYKDNTFEELRIEYIPRNVLSPEIIEMIEKGERIERRDLPFIIYGPYWSPPFPNNMFDYYQIIVVVSNEDPVFFNHSRIKIDNAKLLEVDGVEVRYVFEDEQLGFPVYNNHPQEFRFHIETDGAHYQVDVIPDPEFETTEEEVEQLMKDMVRGILHAPSIN
ncbi:MULTISPECIES: hypothetical protein [Bacillaceae]|uniref:DUF4367 domain-containing protein n=1 Tax=Evansella alkalicola TaxID=745819 RepID=A0ABS6JUE4_9BACI|nr:MULTISPECIES: hypothetical protein [Bacillaceae]MBU9722203.1 hypothetical protein [Bacillus alkalicola]